MDQIDSRITLIEEAGEVLEARNICVLQKNTEHVILIGDHQQLKPKASNYELEEIYNIDLSLFERIYNNYKRKDIQVPILQVQRRMRPEIADFTRLIYGD
jgi:superfamily I DNA and/or RNA helicase